LSHSVQVVGVVWQATTRIVKGVGDLVKRIGDDHIDQVLGGRTIGRSDDIMCGLHHVHGDEERGFLY
jgi:hypothetical protein